MKQSFRAATALTALTLTLSGGALTAQAQQFQPNLPQYTTWQECTKAGHVWHDSDMYAPGCYGQASQAPSAPATTSPAAPETTNDPNVVPGLSEAQCKARGGKIDMSKKDPQTGFFGACVVAPAADTPKPSEPATNDPNVVPGLSEAQCKARGGKIDMSKKDPQTGFFGACVVEPAADTPKPSEPSDSAKPSDSKKPSDSAKPSDSKKPSDSAKPSDSKKPSDSAKPSDSKKPSATKNPSQSAKPSGDQKVAGKTDDAKKPASGNAAKQDMKNSSAQKSATSAAEKNKNGSLAQTGLSLGGLALAAIALVGAGVFLMRRRQNS